VTTANLVLAQLLAWLHAHVLAVPKIWRQGTGIRQRLGASTSGTPTFSARWHGRFKAARSGGRYRFLAKNYL